MDYNKITVEECFVKYHTEKIACVCNGNERKIEFVEE